jgi:hypothetical protein
VLEDYNSWQVTEDLLLFVNVFVRLVICCFHVLSTACYYTLYSAALHSVLLMLLKHVC